MNKKIADYVIRSYQMSDKGEFVTEKIEKFKDRQKNALNMLSVITKNYTTRSQHRYSDKKPKPIEFEEENYSKLKGIEKIVNLAYTSHLTADGNLDKRYGKGSLIIFFNKVDKTLQLLKIEMDPKNPQFEQTTWRQTSTVFNATDKSFKYAQLTSDSDVVTVIDKQQNEAKFWTEKFLQVERINTSEESTKNLINAFKDETIYMDSVGKELRNSILTGFDYFISDKKRKNFTFSDFSQYLIDIKVIKSSKDVFRNLSALDDSFVVDRKTVKFLLNLNVTLDRESGLKLIATSKLQAKSMITVANDKDTNLITIKIPKGVDISELQ